MILAIVVRGKNISSAMGNWAKKILPQIKSIDVAVGVIIGSENKVLVTRRPDNVDQAGLWEFPGGKVESSETIYAALFRELKEELNIEVQSASFLNKIPHSYEKYHVTLHTWCVDAFKGEPIGMQGQPVRWIAVPDLENLNFPEANREIIIALKEKII